MDINFYEDFGVKPLVLTEINLRILSRPNLRTVSRDRQNASFGTYKTQLNGQLHSFKKFKTNIAIRYKVLTSI